MSGPSNAHARDQDTFGPGVLIIEVEQTALALFTHAPLSSSRLQRAKPENPTPTGQGCQGIYRSLLIWGRACAELICTVAVIPAARVMPFGTLSIRMRTGIRWARRTQVKLGLTVA